MSSENIDGRKLDDFVNDLQSEIHFLMKEHLARDDNIKFHEAVGLAKAIEYVNSKFGTNYETALVPIIKKYENPLQH